MISIRFKFYLFLCNSLVLGPMSFSPDWSHAILKAFPAFTSPIWRNNSWKTKSLDSMSAFIYPLVSKKLKNCVRKTLTTRAREQDHVTGRHELKAHVRQVALKSVSPCFESPFSFFDIRFRQTCGKFMCILFSASGWTSCQQQQRGWICD